ncbi:hypothetical protein DWV13_16875 [Clostridium botulinum]|uniref:hypothetical protein n=1 Tax=Clostridium TaxID=1485 RepID=UPI0013FA9D77|nr:MULTISPECIES: hypothetical protein [Clostridium]MCS6133262.1 hypothetical protein [Clostridium botulinum]NFL46727.1 hypothetical protein [Clostridium botulinum]NFL91173.1 hypothetical protein [Clostridium botulinum]
MSKFDNVVNNLLPTWPMIAAEYADEVLDSVNNQIKVKDLAIKVADKMRKKNITISNIVKKISPKGLIETTVRLFNDPKELRAEVERVLKFYNKKTLQAKHEYIKPTNYKKIIW